MESDTISGIIQQGQRVHCALYGGKDGTVVRIYGEQSPATVESLGGVVCLGGSADFDIIWDSGAESKRVPESIVRGVQWKIYDEVVDADDILDAVRLAKNKAAYDREQAEATACRRADERDRFRKEYGHLLTKEDRPEWSSGRLAAANIRKELKAAFPGVKFKVTSDHNSVNVKWTDGPTSEAVEGIAGRYESGSFDGMTDCYNHDPDNTFADVFGGVRFVFVSRDYGERENQLAEQLAKEYDVPFDPDKPWACQIDGESAVSRVRQILGKLDLTPYNGQAVRLVRTGVACGNFAAFWTVAPAPDLELPSDSAPDGPIWSERNILCQDGSHKFPWPREFRKAETAERVLSELQANGYDVKIVFGRRSDSRFIKRVS